LVILQKEAFLKLAQSVKHAGPLSQDQCAIVFQPLIAFHAVPQLGKLVNHPSSNSQTTLCIFARSF